MPNRAPTPAAVAQTIPTQATAHTRTAHARPIPTPRPIPAPVLLASPLPLLDGLLDGIVPEANVDDYGLVIEDLHSGVRTGLNDRQVFPSASLYKLGLAWLALRHADAGVLNLDGPLPIEEADSVEAEPDGGVAPGDTPTVRVALSLMVSLSSNTAAHALLRVLGRTEFNQEMDRIGLSQTRVPLDESEDSSEVAVTSAADIASLLRLIATTQTLSSAANAELMQWLASTAPPDALRDTLPAGVDILEKTGNLDDASNVGALLETTRGSVILVVLDHGVDPGDARGVISQVGLVAYVSLLR